MTWPGSGRARWSARSAGAAAARLAASRTCAARLDPADAVILTCGNPSSMADIKHVAEQNGIRYEKEDWKLVLPFARLTRNRPAPPS